jgi:voltage-gated potassium channel
MRSSDPEITGETLGALNTLVIVLSIYVLVALVLDTILKLPPEVSRLLEMIDNAICAFFIFESVVRFFQAKNKWAFLKWGWIDVVSSVPTMDFMRAGRLVRLVRLLRILRAFRSTRHLIAYVFRNKAKGAFTTVATVAVLMVLFSAVAILQVENDPNSNIKTAEDALWWAYTTVTTVGYGDKYPVTTEGRLVAAALMTTGCGLFGTFTGFVASWFVTAKESEKRQP